MNCHTAATGTPWPLPPCMRSLLPGYDRDRVLTVPSRPSRLIPSRPQVDVADISPQYRVGVALGETWRTSSVASSVTRRQLKLLSKLN